MRLRISVVALFIWAEQEVLLLDQQTLPEPDRWDLPGGGLVATESLEAGLRREVYEETGLVEFEVGELLTVYEAFYPSLELHSLSIIYRCQLVSQPTLFTPHDHEEVGPGGIRWHAITSLKPDHCSDRTWAALKAAQRYTT